MQIADFGMSRITEKKTDPTDTITMGTVTHMPPELLMEGKLSPSADVYAFGALRALPAALHAQPWALRSPARPPGTAADSPSAEPDDASRPLAACATAGPSCLPRAGVLLWSMLTGLRPWNRLSRVQVMVNICIQKKTLEVPDGLPRDLAVRVGMLCMERACLHAHALALAAWGAAGRRAGSAPLDTGSRRRAGLPGPAAQQMAHAQAAAHVHSAALEGMAHLLQPGQLR